MHLLQAERVGETDQTVTATSAADDDWEQLTIGPITPTKPGVCIVRFENLCGAGGAGVCYFDHFTVE